MANAIFSISSGAGQVEDREGKFRDSKISNKTGVAKNCFFHMAAGSGFSTDTRQLKEKGNGLAK